jgi:WD repeat-containing protein 19
VPLLLKRLAKHASKFPAHATNILIMAVAELSRAGMKKSAFEIASMLLQPEFEGKLKPDVLKKIQTTVRRRDTTEAEEPVSPCPVCDRPLAVSELYCGNCKSNLPFDTFTALHMRRDDWCECPGCTHAASYAAMSRAKKCPFCEVEVPAPTAIVAPVVSG